MHNMVSASTTTSYPSNYTNPSVTSSKHPPTPPPTSYNDSNVSSHRLHISHAHPQHQHTIASHISSLLSLKKARDPASKPTATTTCGQNSITNSTTQHLTNFTSSQAYFPLKYLTPSSPSAAVYHKIDYHPGFSSPPSNANFVSHYLTELINPSAHVGDATTHSVIISFNVDESTKLEPTI